MCPSRALALLLLTALLSQAIAGDTSPRAARYVKQLSDPDPALRSRAARGLERMAPLSRAHRQQIARLCRKARRSRGAQACQLLRAMSRNRRQKLRVLELRRQRFRKGPCEIRQLRGMLVHRIQGSWCPETYDPLPRRARKARFILERLRCGALKLGPILKGQPKATLSWACIPPLETFSLRRQWKHFVTLRHRSRKATGWEPPSAISYVVETHHTYDTKTGKRATLTQVYPTHHKALIAAARLEFRHAFRTYRSLGGGVYQRIRGLRKERIRFAPERDFALVYKERVVGFPYLREIQNDAPPALDRRVVQGFIYVAIPRSVQALSRSLRSGDRRVRIAAIQALGRMGPRAAKAVYALRSLLLHEPSNSRFRHVARALGDIGPKASIAAWVLLRALKVTHPQVEAAAVDALSKMGEPVVSILLRSQRNPHEPAKQVALAALARIGKAALPRLLKALKSRSRWTRLRMLSVVARMGPVAAPAVPLVLKDLSHKRVYMRLAAAEALGAIGPKAARAKAALGKACTHKDPRLRHAALVALSHIETSAEALKPRILRAFRDPSFWVRRAALLSSAKLGPALALAVLPQVRKALAASSLRLQAIRTLGRLGPQAAKAAADLRRPLTSPLTSRAAWSTLKGWGKDALLPVIQGLKRKRHQPRFWLWPELYAWCKKLGAEATSGLTRALQHKDEATLAVALMVLQHMGPKGASLAGRVVPLLKSPHDDIREAAARALGFMGSSAAVAGLIEALKDPEPEVQSAAIAALGQLGPKAAQAKAPLRRLARHSHHRRACRRALRQIQARP